MKHTITAHSPKFIALLLAVLVLSMPTDVIYAGVGEFFYEYIVIGFFGMLLGWAGTVLDYGINTFVVGFGTQYESGGIGFVVEEIWVLVRDVFNLIFIFGLVYIGFKMILRTDDGQSRRWLVTLILAALMVNFSLFITKFVVDFSNILAVEFINTGLNDETFIIDEEQAEPELSVALSMLKATNVMTTLDVGDDFGASLDPDDNYALIFGTMLLFLVAMFVFISAGILLIIRAAVLIVLMMLSPFLFLGWVLPMFSSLSRKLWSTLFSRAFLAPIYIFFLYITLRVASSFLTGGGAGGNFAEVLASTEGGDAAFASKTGAAFGPFIITIVFLMMSLVVAQRLGAEGASRAIAIGNNMRRRGQRAVANSARWTRNQTAGRAARNVSNRVGRRLDRGLQNLQTRDGRLGRIARSNAVTGSVGAGAQNMQNARFGMQRSIAEEQRMRNETERRANRRGSQNAADVRRMSQEELAIMNQEELNQIAEHLTDAQLNALENSGQRSTEEVDELRERRDQRPIADLNATIDLLDTEFDDLNDAVGALRRNIQGMSHERRANLGIDQLTDQRIAMHLRDSDIEGLRDQGFDAGQINAIETARRNANATYARTGLPPDQNGAARVPANYRDPEVARRAGENRERFMQNAQQAGQLDPDVFADPNMAEYLTPQAVEERMRNGRMTNAQLENIRRNIENEITRGSLPEVDRKARMWRQWSQRSTYGAQLGISESALSGGTNT